MYDMFQKSQGIYALIVLVCFTARAGNLPFDNSGVATVEGIQIHYRLWEVEGRPARGSVFLVHGFAASTISWDQVADSLNQTGYEVVAVDVPPFGYSDKSHRMNQSITAHARRFHQLIQEVFPGREWHMAGHSMGGGIVQAYALMYPDDLLCVTFVAASLFDKLPGTPHAVNPLLRFSTVRFVIGEVARVWYIGPRRVESLLASAYGIEPTKEQVSGYLQPLLAPGMAMALLSSAFHYFEIADLDASGLQIPALAIWGDSDNWVPHKSRQHILKKMPETELILLNGAGHIPMETHPEDFMQAWLPFIRQCRR